MAITVRIKMLRPVGGYEVGAYRTLGIADAERLADRGTAEIVGKPAREKPLAVPKKRGAKKAAQPAKKRAARVRNKMEPPAANKSN